MKKYSYLFLIFLVSLIPEYVFASSDIDFSCSSEVLVGNRVTCIVKLKSTDTILGGTLEYEYSDALTYEKTILDDEFLTLANSSKGVTIVNENGFQNSSKIATISFLISNNAIPSTVYSVKLKNIQLSDGENDILIGDKEASIKVLSLSEIVNYISVNDSKLEIKDGITNYTVTVPNTVRQVKVLSELSSDKLQFVENKGPRTISGLKVGDNIFDLVIENEEEILVNYKINVKRLTEGEILEDVDNPKTGSIAIVIIVGILIISLFSLFFVGRKRLVN